MEIYSQQKLDLTHADKSYYSAKTIPQLLQLSEIVYLSLTGEGAPEGDSFANAVEALYTVAYSAKQMCKKNSRDFVVPKLEGLWWTAYGSELLEVPRDHWHWRLLIRMPDFVDQKLAAEACAMAAAKKRTLNQIRSVTFEGIDEGTCVQIMHVGPYSTEPETIEKLQAFMQQHRFVQNGLHHEIYLSDPRKVNPAQMKTIVRYPVKSSS